MKSLQPMGFALTGGIAVAANDVDGVGRRLGVVERAVERLEPIAAIRAVAAPPRRGHCQNEVTGTPDRQRGHVAAG